MNTVIGNPRGTNLITDEEGRTYHLGIKSGEVANRIVLVGEVSRAERLCQLLSDVRQTGTTHRGFHTFTGTFDGKTVTIMAIGMGFPMMDFAVREIAQVTTGDLYMVRLGTCGTINQSVSIGTIAIAERSTMVRTKYSASAAPYDFDADILNASSSLTKAVKEKLTQSSLTLACGTDITCDTFYASQGRIDPQFEDRNASLLIELAKTFKDSCSLQMETYQLFHLANIVRGRKIHAAAVAIVIAQRHTTEFLSNSQKHELETTCGLALLKALGESMAD